MSPSSPIGPPARAEEEEEEEEDEEEDGDPNTPKWSKLFPLTRAGALAEVLDSFFFPFARSEETLAVESEEEEEEVDDDDDDDDDDEISSKARRGES